MRWSPIYSDWLSPFDPNEPGPIEDVAVLEQAEIAVRTVHALDANLHDLAGWTTAMRPVRVGGYLINPGANAFAITSCLDSANIAYVWDPYPPQLMPMFRPGNGAVDRPFSLYVPGVDLEDASALLLDSGIATSDWSAFSAPVTADRTPEAEHFRLMRFFWIMVIAYSPQLLAGFAALAVIVALRWAALLGAAVDFAHDLIARTR